MTQKKKKSGWKKWRKLFNDVHLWLGIASGLVLFVVCLSGTIYTFRQEAEELLEPSKYYVETKGETPLSPDVLIQKAEEASGGKALAITMPENNAKAYQINIKKSAEDRRGTGYFIDQYTGNILGDQESAVSAFFLTMMKLHRWLLIEGDTGKIIVGISTIIFVLLTLTGIVIWFPIKLKNWRQGLKIKTTANWKRVNHDLHNTLGFYSFLLLLIMGLTGLCWSFGWYRDGLSKVMGAEVFGARKEKPMDSTLPADSAKAKPLSISSYLAVADELLSYEGNYRVSLPSSAEAAVVISKSKNGFFALAASDKVQLDQYSAAPLKVDKFADKAFNEKIVALIRPLHTGEVMGLFSKILYFLACLFATSLPVTGTIIWINSLRKKPKKKKKNHKMKEKEVAMAH